MTDGSGDPFQAFVGRGCRGHAQRGRDDGWRAAQARAAKDKRRKLELEQAGNHVDRRDKHPWIVPGAIDQRKTAIENVAGNLRNGLIERQIDQRADSQIDDATNVAHIAGISQPERVLFQLVHKNLSKFWSPGSPRAVDPQLQAYLLLSPACNAEAAYCPAKTVLN